MIKKSKNYSNGVVVNLFWKFAERISAQLVTLVVSVILARLLEPSDYGVIALVTIFITFANVFVSDGFGSALIQKKDADALDFSSVLYFNISFSIVLYIILFVGAPLIAKFYGDGYDILIPIMRLLGLRLILSAINSVQQAYVSKNMIFKKFFLSTLLGTVLSGVVGIVMAYKGFGAWALVTQYLTNTTVDTFVLQLVLNKWPVKKFSWNRIKGLINYGYKILLTSIIITGYQEIRALIIGKLYSAKDLAFYDKGKQFPNLVTVNINASIGAVLFPKMSQNQDDPTSLKQITKLSIRNSSYVLFPVMLGLAGVANNFVLILLTEKWLPCVHILQILCFFYLFQPIQTANTQAVKALGRSDITLKLEIFRDVIQLAVLLVVMWISVDAIVISMAVLSFLFVFVNGYPNIKLLKYPLKEQVMDIFPPLIMSLIMMFTVMIIGMLPINVFVLLPLQILLGVVIYVSLSVITKNKELLGLLDLVRQTLKR